MELILELRNILFEAKSNWTVLDVIKDILGAGKVSIDKDNIKPGQFWVQENEQGDGWYFSAPLPGKQEDWMKELDIPAPKDFPGRITTQAKLTSRKLADIAAAAHEAYHAWLQSKSPGVAYKNEKMVNVQATKWLKKNLTGLELHAALEIILHSKISYNHN